VLVVWSGCADDDDFAIDPASGFMLESNSPEDCPCVRWTRQTIRVDIPDSVDTPTLFPNDGEYDDLRIPGARSEGSGDRPARLVHLASCSGILYPPTGQILSVDPRPDAADPVAYRSPNDTLGEGIYVVLLDDVDAAELGDVRSSNGKYSRDWKARLQQEARADMRRLVRGLEKEGLNLAHLEASIDRWSEAPTTVIHAPQRLEHFHCLCRVLGYGAEFWHRAWREIQESRVNAIQTGRLESQIVEEAVELVLRQNITELRGKALTSSNFEIPMPPGSGLRGSVRLVRVEGIEDGFCAPDTELRAVQDLGVFETWRS
jgi:hypothetical protein